MESLGFKNEKHVWGTLESTPIAILVVYIQPKNLKNRYAVFGF